MRFSGIREALLHKYRNEEDPKTRKRKKKRDKVFYVSAAVLMIAAVVLNVVSGWNPVEDSQEAMAPWATPLVLPGDNTNVNLLDYSGDVQTLPTTEQRINNPSVYGFELLFSAGEGSLEEPILTKLYLYNTQTGNLKNVATSKLGEIYETYLSGDWIVWVDTDNAGTNAIYKLDRTNPDAQPVKIQTTENHVPKLALYGDYLIWMEQTSDTQDQLYFVSLSTDENMALQEFDKTNYAISSPCIYKNMVIWAADDDKGDGTTSNINYVTFEELGMSQSEEGAEETGSGDMDIKSYSPGTYVHEPMCNDDVFVWIDKNKAPDSNLYYAYKTGDTKAVLLHKDVTSFTVGNDFIVYCYNQIIYAYFYKQGTLVQVSQSNNYAMLPQAYGSLIVWEDKTGKATSDVFKYNIVE